MLTTTSAYALRALTALAGLGDGATALGRDLARDADIPANYLSKILLTLSRAGFIAATRGSGGGYRLAMPPNEIRLIDVVELFEGTRAMPQCLLGSTRECSDADPCTAHAAWRDVRQAYVSFLENTTVEAISEHGSGAFGGRRAGNVRKIGTARRAQGGRR